VDWTFMFFFNSALLGVGLAMDAFSVSLANGLGEPKMNAGRMCVIAGVFAFFQFAMPVIGWVCVSTVAEHFTAFEKWIPWIALALLGCIGGKMARVIRIPNSLQISEILISENLLPEAQKNPDIQILSEPFVLPFDAKGNLF